MKESTKEPTTGPTAYKSMGVNFYAVMFFATLGGISVEMMGWHNNGAIIYMLAMVFVFGIREISWAIRVSKS